MRESSKRIDRMLGRDMAFSEAPAFPAREDLQVNKGLYLDCVVLYIRLKPLRKRHVRHHNKLSAFVFSTLVTELINLFETHSSLYDVKTEHNCIWAIFKTDAPDPVNHVFTTAIQVRTLMKVMNMNLVTRMRMELDYTISLDAGTAILMKSDLMGRLESDKSWIGDHFDSSFKMASFFRDQNEAFPLRLSGGVYQRLSAENQMLCQWYHARKFYHCNELWAPVKNFTELTYQTDNDKC